MNYIFAVSKSAKRQNIFANKDDTDTHFIAN